MKKMISFVLILATCLSLCACGKDRACSCDCAQCALCTQKTHSHEIVDTFSESSFLEEKAEADKRKIQLPEPVLLAEDQKVRVELIGFFEEDSPYKHIGKYVTMRFTCKADYEIGIRLVNIAVDGCAVDCSYPRAETPNLLPGETTTYHFEILDSFQNPLDSVDQLYTLKGRFKVSRRTGTNSYADAYEIPFSIPNSLNGTPAVSDAASIYYGKWQVTDVKVAGESDTSKKDETMEAILKGILDVLDDTYFVFAESGDCCYYTQKGTTLGKWKATDTGVTAGTNVLVAEGKRLVCERDGFLLYWEKVSESQAFPQK